MVVLEAFGFGGIGIKGEDFLEKDAVIQLGYPPNRIDLVTGIDGVSFAEAWDKRVPGEFDGIGMQFISRDLLLKNKRAAGRPKALADVDALGDA